MPTEVSNTINEFSPILAAITWPGVTALIIWRVLGPLTNLFIRFLKSKNNNLNWDVAERVQRIETNHLTDVKKDIEELKQNFKDLWTRSNKFSENQIKIREDVAWIKAKINGK